MQLGTHKALPTNKEKHLAKELPYLPTYKNVEKLFKAIDAAKKPDAVDLPGICRTS
jgi:hypothetical protein